MATSTNDDKGVTASVSDVSARFADIEITTGTLTLDDADFGVIYERGRTLALGEQITPAFSASQFSANVGTWTVAAGDVFAYEYSLVGLDLHLTFWINTSSVSGAPVSLYLLIPGGRAAASSVLTTFIYSDNGGAGSVGFAQVIATNGVIQLMKPGGATWANATNTTSVAGQIRIQLRALAVSPSAPSAPIVL